MCGRRVRRVLAVPALRHRRRSDGSGITLFRTQTPVFSYTLPEYNLFGGAPAGTTATTRSRTGSPQWLKPLSVGQHRLVISLQVAVSAGSRSTTHNLTVIEKHAD